MKASKFTKTRSEEAKEAMENSKKTEGSENFKAERENNEKSSKANNRRRSIALK